MLSEYQSLCSDCYDLVLGARSLPGPHDDLVTRGADPGYLCLICDAHLLCEGTGSRAIWSREKIALRGQETSRDGKPRQPS